MTNAQELGKGLLTSNFPMDMHIAELLISDDAAKKLNVKLSILQRTIKLGTSVEANPFGDDSAVASSINAMTTHSCVGHHDAMAAPPTMRRSSHIGAL